MEQSDLVKLFYLIPDPEFPEEPHIRHTWKKKVHSKEYPQTCVDKWQFCKVCGCKRTERHWVDGRKEIIYGWGLRELYGAPTCIDPKSIL